MTREPLCNHLGLVPYLCPAACSSGRKGSSSPSFGPSINISVLSFLRSDEQYQDGLEDTCSLSAENSLQPLGFENPNRLTSGIQHTNAVCEYSSQR
jgi:hypothetical protein